MSRLPNSVRETVRLETRVRLMTAAAAEFAREGYIGANINRISSAAGFAKGTIYNYFPSKEALMLTLISEIAMNHIDSIRAEVDQCDTPIAKLEAFFRSGFAFVRSHPAQARVVINAVYGPNPDFVAHVHYWYQPLYKLLIRDILKAGVTRGDFHPMEADPTAGLVMTIYLGSCALLLQNDDLPLGLERTMAFVLDGIRAGG